MLTSLIIRNLALIDELAIEFTDGLNIVTGETGAGKSVVIGAVQLLLGQRADRSLIRHGADACEVAGIFEFAAGSRLLAAVDSILEAAGAPACDDGQLLLKRWFSEKSARVFANASPVTLGVLRELGELLVDVHGPYDHQSLLRPGRQLAVLDASGDHEPALAACRDLHARWRAAQEELRRSGEEQASPEMVDLLRFQVDEIGAALLQPGEDEELKARHAKVAHASQILETVARAKAILSDSEGAVMELLAQVTRDLQDLERIDAEGGSHLRGLVDTAYNEVQNLADELGEYADNVEIDPREFEELEERLALLQRLKRKYGGSIERVLEHARETHERLARLENIEAYRATLAARVEEAEQRLRAAAAEVSRARQALARQLAPRIARKLKRLGFPKGTFDIQLGAAELGSNGLDAVEFYVAPNPGEGSQPLRAIASSGEIARIMLAIKTVLAAADDVPLLIFDEVDANIGGEVAVIVGEELHNLGRDRQLICITHLPQIAAEGDRHFRVVKRVKGKRTIAHMEQLDDDGRVAELARMLGGESSSSVVRQHARELLTRRGAGS